MGFQRLDLLPVRDQAKGHELTARWETYKGSKVANAIIDGIKRGAGKYFMEYIFEDHEPGVLRHSCDMAGLALSSLDLKFDDDCDTFKYIDFSYAAWYGSTFKMASFFQCHISFTKFYNIRFEDCIFASHIFMAANLSDVLSYVAIL